MVRGAAAAAPSGEQGLERRGNGGEEVGGGWLMIGGHGFRGGGRRKPKNDMWVCLNRLGARVRGFWRGFGPSDLDLAVPDARRGRLGLGGLCRGGWAERRGEKCSPATVSETETPDEYTDYIAVIFNGWAVKRTPNATKLGRRPAYTIIRPHDKLQPIPRTFLCHL